MSEVMGQYGHLRYGDGVEVLPFGRVREPSTMRASARQVYAY